MGQVLSYNAIKQYFKKQYNKLNVKGLNLHTFRHTFVTMCYYVGIKGKTIQTMVGHATLEMTMNTYTHVLEKGNSEFLPYFIELKNTLEGGPTDFMNFNTS